MEHWFYRKSVKKIKWNKQKIFRERARPSSSKLIFDWTEWYNWLFWRMKVGPKKRFEWIYGLCPTQIWLFLIIIFCMLMCILLVLWVLYYRFWVLFTIEFLHSYNTTKLRYIASCPCVLKSKRGIVNFDMSSHYSTQAVLVFMKLILSQAPLYMAHSIMINESDLVMLINGILSPFFTT